MATYEAPPFPRAVKAGKAITEYDKDPKWTTKQVNSYLWEAIDDIHGWFKPEYHFQTENTLNKLDQIKPSFSVVFSSEHSSIWLQIAERYGITLHGLDINDVLREEFAQGFKVSYSTLAQKNSKHIDVPSDPLGHFGWADQPPGAKDLKYFDSHYVTGSRIHPFYLYRKESSNWIIGQDPHRIQVDVQLQTAAQFLNQFQPLRRELWITQNHALSMEELSLLARLEAIDNERAIYDLEKLDGIEAAERELLPKPRGY